MRHRSFALFILLAVLFGHGLTSVLAQGLGRDDRKAIATLDALERVGDDWPLPPFVDLRALLPEVGEQSMNDCAAWAFGYAARSHLHASFQNWRPIYETSIFSPSYIYNQVNQGRDEGSNPMDVIHLLQKGAATLFTAPYKPKDFLTPPPSSAMQEAPTFLIAGAKFLPDGQAIRRVLAAGHVVAIGVRTNPIFNQGRYFSYTRALHEQAKLTRRPGQPHGYHAMVICGYSDEKRAFLFMNSWGKKWGQDGFVWVDYDVVDVFNNAQSNITDNLMDFACVLVSDGVPVIFDKDKYRRADFTEVVATVRGHFHSFDETDRPRYAVEATLSGPYSLRDRVQSVEWSGTVDGQPWSSEGPRDSMLSFPARTLSGNTQLEVTARITFTDGTVLTSRSKLDLPPVRPRFPEVRRVDKYYGLNSAGEPCWHAVYYPSLTEEDWHNLKSIEWKQGAVMLSTSYTHPGGGNPAITRLIEHHDLMAKQPRKGAGAIFTFRDGQVRSVALPESPFVSPATKDPVLESRVRLFGREGSRIWHQIEHEVSVPQQDLWAVEDVILSTGSAYSPNEYTMQRVTERDQTRFVFTEFTSEPRQAQARVLWRRGARGAEYSNTTTVLTELTPSDRGYSLTHRDLYAGERNGEAVWRHEVGLHTLNLSEMPEEVVWQAGSGKEERWDSSTRFGGDFLTKHFSFESGAEPLEVVANVKLRENSNTTRTITLRRTVQASAARNDALAVLVREGVQDNWKGEAPPKGLTEVALSGPSHALARARSVHLFQRSAEGSRSVLSSGDQGLLASPEAQRLRLPVAPGASVVEGWIQLNDDGAMAVSTPVRPLSPFTYAPALQLEAVEHYLGQAGGKPTWRVGLAVRGDLDVIPAIERIDYHALAIDGTTVPVNSAANEVTRSWLTTSEPLTVSATVHFKPEVATPAIVLKSVVYTAAPRRPEVIDLEVATRWRAPKVLRPGDTIADMQEPEAPRVLRLIGPKQLLTQVADVTYRRVPLDGGASKVMRVTQSERDALDGFPQRDDTPLGRHRYEAAVRLKDGTQLKLQKETENTGEPDPTPTVTGTATYWGEEAGEPLYLVRWEIAPAADVSRVAYEPAAAIRVLGSTGLTSFARQTFPIEALVSARAGAKLTAVSLTVPAFEGAATSQTLAVAPEPTWELALPLAKREPSLQILPDPLGFAEVSYFRIHAPASLLSQTERVVYEVKANGTTRRLTPFAQGCETGGIFDCRWLGTRPDSITATLYDREGKVLVQVR